MGRKSLKTERVSQILDAFERCLERNGLPGTSLDNVAGEAGMARRMVRHYVGNRADLIHTAVARIIERFNMTVFELIDQSNPEDRFRAALDYVFSEAFNELPATRLVAALLPASLYDEQVRKAVKSIYDAFQSGLDQELKRHLPNAPDHERSQVAYSIMCLSFGGGWMGNIGFDRTFNLRNKQIAEDLITHLKNTSGTPT